MNEIYFSPYNISKNRGTHGNSLSLRVRHITSFAQIMHLLGRNLLERMSEDLDIRKFLLK